MGKRVGWVCGAAVATATIVSGACSDRTAGEGLSSQWVALTAAGQPDVLGFEDPSAWRVAQGTSAAPVASDVHTEGNSSIAVKASNFVVLKSRPFPVSAALTRSAAVDLFLPAEQPNPYWFGAVQLYLECPSQNVFNAFSGQVELTGLTPGAFHTLAFAVPASVTLALDAGCVDFVASLALNVPWDATGTYLLDNLRIGTVADSLTSVLSCVFKRDPDLHFARWEADNAAPLTVDVPVGPENGFAPGDANRGQPTSFPPGTTPTFTTPFDGKALGWQLGPALATASDESPSCPPVWVPSWTGRGPLSTTITTNKTTLDPVPDLSGRTLRLMAHLTTGGSKVKVKLSQRFSPDALDVADAHVALRTTGSTIDPATDRPLTFGGSAAVTVPGGQDVWSDEIDLPVRAGQDLALSFYIPGHFVPATEGGRGGTKTSYFKLGDQVATTTLPTPGITRGVFVAYEVQVLSAGPAAAILALGDSITEGACSAADQNGDWPDLLAGRLPLLSDGTAVAVLNEGIGSGRFASSDGAGLRGLVRLDEYLQNPSVRWVTLLMGVNDISYELVSASFLTDAYATAITNVHAAGKKIIGIPILPFGGSTKDVGNNKQVAQEANAWIRAHDKRLGADEPAFDAVVDLESVVSDPADLTWSLQPGLTCDKVHPNQAGYSALAAAFPLDVFN